MLVHSHDRFAGVGDFDPTSGTLVEFERDQAPSDLLEAPLGGHSADLNGVRAIIFRDGNTLRLNVGNQSWQLDDEIRLEWASSEGTSTFRVRRGGAVLCAVEYGDGPIPGLAIEDDPTPMVEREDFDFGLFVRNVLADPERMVGMYEN